MNNRIETAKIRCAGHHGHAWASRDRYSWDESKHPRGQPDNKGQFTDGTQGYLAGVIEKGIEIRAKKHAEVDDMDFESERPSGFVKTQVTLSDGTDFRCTLHFEIDGGKATIESVDTDSAKYSKPLRRKLAAGGNLDGFEQLNLALNEKRDSLLTLDVLNSIRDGIEREIRLRKKDRDLGKIGESLSIFRKADTL